MRPLLTALLLVVVSLVAAQPHLPYHQTWEGLPFEKAFAQVQQMRSVTSYPKVRGKRAAPPDHEEATFDSLGRCIHYKNNVDDMDFEYCWAYSAEGCPVSMVCGTDEGKPMRQQNLVCSEGRIDTFFVANADIRVYEYGSSGRLVKVRQFQKHPGAQSFELLDSTIQEYDGEGRLARSTSSQASYQIHYHAESISIEFFSGSQRVARQELRCGPHGLPVQITHWRYDGRKRREVMTKQSTLSYTFRE